MTQQPGDPNRDHRDPRERSDRGDGPPPHDGRRPAVRSRLPAVRPAARLPAALRRPGDPRYGQQPWEQGQPWEQQPYGPPPQGYPPQVPAGTARSAGAAAAVGAGVPPATTRPGRASGTSAARTTRRSTASRATDRTTRSSTAHPQQDIVATLSVDDGSGRSYQLQRGSNVVGRGQDAAFRLPDTSVSRRHVDVYFDGQSAVLHDLGSTNGTTVNGSSVQTWQLADGDVIHIGHSTVVFSSRY